MYQQALDVQPEDIDALVGMAWAQIDLEQVGSAIATFNRVLSRSPKYAEAYMGLAEAHNLRGMKSDAIKNYRRYLDLEPYGPESEAARQMIKALQ